MAKIGYDMRELEEFDRRLGIVCLLCALMSIISISLARLVSDMAIQYFPLFFIILSCGSVILFGTPSREIIRQKTAIFGFCRTDGSQMILAQSGDMT